MIEKIRKIVLIVAVVVSVALVVEAQDGISTATYGADVSYPMHRHTVLSAEIGNPLGTNKQEQYQANMDGCIDYYNQAGHNGHEACWEVELERIAMNLRQPHSMINYTRNGFVKIRAPPEVWQLVQEFWKANREELIDEEWSVGSIFVNHWKSPAHFVAVDNATLPGGGHILKNHIWNAARDTLSEWTGYQMADCSCYGVRVYQEGAILAPHVDRLPLVSSAILNVDQDLDEPWPLEVIGHDGLSHNITMEPGDLILYESHSIIHGRPFPLKGRFMANIFMHFEPVAPLSEPNPVFRGELPPYIIPGSLEESNWRKNNPDGWYAVQTKRITGGTTEAHLAAVRGELEELRSVLDIHPAYANAADEFGWTPLHEATRRGNQSIAQLLIERGANKDAITNAGESVLGLAYNYVQTRDPDYNSNPDAHPLIHYLNNLEAKYAMPETAEEL